MFLWGVISFAAGEEGGWMKGRDAGAGAGKRQSGGRRQWGALWSPADSGE